MATDWTLKITAAAPPDTYRAWLAARPGCGPHPRVSDDPLLAVISGCLTAQFDSLGRGVAESFGPRFGFRPTHSYYFSDWHRDVYAAKLEVYRVAFAFLRDFSDDCYFNMEDIGLFVRVAGRLLVNEAEFTFNDECSAFLRPPSLLISYQAATGHAPDLEHRLARPARCRGVSAQFTSAS